MDSSLELVPNAETALQIGLRAIEDRFGPAMVEKYKPFSAVLIHKEWLVVGNIDHDGSISKLQEASGSDTFISVRGGAPGASISSEDGRVLSVSFGR